MATFRETRCRSPASPTRVASRASRGVNPLQKRIERKASAFRNGDLALRYPAIKMPRDGPGEQCGNEGSLRRPEYSLR
jgi:hypothetical protein